MKTRKGILLAGGKGSRLYPITSSINKHFLAVYDKPMYYYSLSILMLAGIKEILIISNEKDIPIFKDALGDGKRFGIQLEYAIQKKPNGIPEAFIIAEDFLQGSPSCLVLGDNFIYGQGLRQQLIKANNKNSAACIFCYSVEDPREFGTAEIDDNHNVIRLVEKPTDKKKSAYAITGIYMFDQYASRYAKALSYSSRNELEVIDLLECYLKYSKINVEHFGRGMAWLDMGTPERILRASNYIETMFNRQRLKVACLEEIAWVQGWLDDRILEQQSQQLAGTKYGEYLRKLLINNKAEIF
jgi:glucose-1-phosphate thymidylyltransferase